MSAISMSATGNLVADPELKFTGSGIPVASFTVAVNERVRRGDGSWDDGPTSFVRCNAWRELAEHVCESLAKGDRVMVAGQFREREWEAKPPLAPGDSGKRRTWELSVTEVGAELRYATVKISRAARRSDGPPPPDDPWEAREAPQDEPPF